MNDIRFLVCDSLEKVFIDCEPHAMSTSIPLSAFLGESVDFQVAVHLPASAIPSTFTVHLDSISAEVCTVREVKNVPCQAVRQSFDEHYLRTDTGRYPDLLAPLESAQVTWTEAGWHALWVTLRVDTPSQAGPRPVTITLSQEEHTAFEQTVLINVLPRQLPPLPIYHTEWFHCDALADYYNVSVFSEEHWTAIDRFMGSLAAVDVNMLLTPIWTPPLDTAVGSYRTPVQLIGVSVDAGRYSFEFSRLHRWINLARKHGITNLEMAHLFTQWGAKATPAVYGTVDGKNTRLFGWDVEATSPRWREFLEALLPELTDFLAREWSLDRVWFHVSDEPHGPQQRASYRAARDVVAPLLRGMHLIDALSDVGYWHEGLVRTPVAANNSIDDFLKAGVCPLWTYYCVSQQLKVSNRFITLPSIRNRILARQVYAADLQGFLHWGFNFYYSELSAHLVDPFHDTTAAGAFPGGDPFLVYPGPHMTPLESIRYRVLAAAMADLRAMALLESLAGRRAVLEIIDPDGSLTFSSFSYDVDEYRRIRERLNEAIMALPN